MRRRRWARGGRAAVLLGVLTLLLAGCSAQDWERNLRFGFPTGVTKQAHETRVLWTWAGVAALILGVIVWGLIFWCCLRYRKKDDVLPRQTKYNFVIEATCVVIPLLIVAGLFYRTVIVEDDINHLSKHPDVAVQADAFKWNWQFEYHQYRPGGGAQPIQDLYTDSSGKPLTNPQHPSQPFYLSTVGSSNEIPILVLPVHKTVQIDEHSLDVIHSFWVPEFLFKRDVIPYGTNSSLRDNKFEFTATSTGSFVGRCAELCGTYHSQMNFEVRIVPQKTFVAYLAALNKIGPADPRRQAEALKIAMPGHSPYATTTYPFNTSRTADHASHRSGG